jgi:hypothetical protein
MQLKEHPSNKNAHYTPASESGRVLNYEGFDPEFFTEIVENREKAELLTGTNN